MLETDLRIAKLAILTGRILNRLGDSQSLKFDIIDDMVNDVWNYLDNKYPNCNPCDIAQRAM